MKILEAEKFKNNEQNDKIMNLEQEIEQMRNARSELIDHREPIATDVP